MVGDDGFIAEAEKKVWIPEVPVTLLVELLGRIKPIVHFEGLGDYYIKPMDLFSVYTYDPTPTERASGLTELCEITTFHVRWHRIRFNPTIADVLAQIPPAHLDKVVAFQIISDPTRNDPDPNEEAFGAGYHSATTRLYVRKE